MRKSFCRCDKFVSLRMIEEKNRMTKEYHKAMEPCFRVRISQASQILFQIEASVKCAKVIAVVIICFSRNDREKNRMPIEYQKDMEPCFRVRISQASQIRFQIEASVKCAKVIAVVIKLFALRMIEKKTEWQKNTKRLWNHVLGSEFHKLLKSVFRSKLASNAQKKLPL